jgi:hypothetical protein
LKGETAFRADKNMAFCLDQVVPWGRSFTEYRRMFALTQADLELRILGCADGPTRFNAEATSHGFHVVSADPIYAFSRSEIERRIQATYPEVLKQTRQNASEFVWTEIRSVEELGRVRMASMERFLDDYEAGRNCGRYLAAELPALPFKDQAFELGLSSHFLFLYADKLSLEFHINSIVELYRVANEVRIFPLLGLGSRPSRFVIPAIEALRRLGLSVKIETVTYEFQRGGNQMMRIVR